MANIDLGWNHLGSTGRYFGAKIHFEAYGGNWQICAAVQWTDQASESSLGRSEGWIIHNFCYPQGYPPQKNTEVPHVYDLFPDHQKDTFVLQRCIIFSSKLYKGGVTQFRSNHGEVCTLSSLCHMTKNDWGSSALKEQSKPKKALITICIF